MTTMTYIVIHCQLRQQVRPFSRSHWQSPLICLIQHFPFMARRSGDIEGDASGLEPLVTAGITTIAVSFPWQCRLDTLLG
ncbi:MAG: hypothetical protein R3E31_05455 [Chloroflexota bacterium]